MMVMFQIYAYSDKYDIKTANHSSFWQNLLKPIMVKNFVIVLINLVICPETSEMT